MITEIISGTRFTMLCDLEENELYATRKFIGDYGVNMPYEQINEWCAETLGYRLNCSHIEKEMTFRYPDRDEHYRNSDFPVIIFRSVADKIVFLLMWG